MVKAKAIFWSILGAIYILSVCAAFWGAVLLGVGKGCGHAH